MTKVYPSASASSPLHSPKSPSDGCQTKTADPDPVVLTVWKKSLLFNCDGFTVFDSNGNLVYRVDNYMSASKGQIFLMDAHGTTLLTIRRKKLSLGDTWLVLEGETTDNPRFLVRKNASLLNPKCLAHVMSTAAGGNNEKKEKKSSSGALLYEIEGSYAQRCCAIYDHERRMRVAEIKQKEASVRGVAFGKDVFSLFVQPGFDTALAMAIVILLDQMFASSRRLNFNQLIS